MACESSGGHLGGSLDQIYRINFSETRVRRYDNHISVEYVAPGEVVPVRVSLDRRSNQLGTGTFDLKEGGDIAGRLRSGVEIPRFTTGKISFSDYGEQAGDVVAGEFSATFDVDDRSFGLEGRFSSPLEVVMLPYPATGGGPNMPALPDGSADAAASDASQGDAAP